MTTNPPANGQGSDALAQLEALLQKTKTAKSQTGASKLAQQPVADGLLPGAEAEAERLAKEQAEKEAAFQARLEQAELERTQALEEQQSKMAELAQTPQYQARVQQTEAAKEVADQQKSELEGHEIRQVTTAKL